MNEVQILIKKINVNQFIIYYIYIMLFPKSQELFSPGMEKFSSNWEIILANVCENS